MSLWHRSDDRWVRSTLERANLGADAYLCCPGPSLKSVDPATLRGPGRVVVGINKSYPFLKPDLWVGMDMPSCFDRRLWWEPFPKITRWEWRHEVAAGRYIHTAPLTFFARLDDDAHPATMFRRREGDVAFCWDNNTLMGALHVLVWMGARRIHLVGCDMGGTGDYHDGTVLEDKLRAENRELYAKQVRDLLVLWTEGRCRGIEFISCTPDSPLNKFMPYVPLAEAVAASEARVPKDDTDAPILHVRKAEQCLWKNLRDGAGDGVVVGVVGDQTWMLPWWWRNFSRTNPQVPVAFADFGMSDEWRAWCAERGKVIGVTDTPATGWFRKPFAILRAPFKRILWLDLDTEVRGPIGGYFDYSAAGKIAAGTRDTLTTPEGDITRWGWHANSPKGTVPICSGLLVVEHGNPIISEWAVRCVEPVSAKWRGDNELLAALCFSFRVPLHPIPSHELSMKINPSDPNATVIHYASPQAKDLIRKAIQSGAA